MRLIISTLSIFIFFVILSFLNSNAFCSLHDENFETDEKNYCRIDVLKTLYNTKC